MNLVYPDVYLNREQVDGRPQDTHHAMTRLIKGPGTDVLENEYVYAEPSISFDDLATKYGLSRSNIAAKARVGQWTKKREDFRRRLREETRAALAERWAEFQTANYERLMKMAAAYLDQYQAALEAGDIKVSTRDMLGIAAMMRTYLSDMTEQPVSDPKTVNLDGEEIDPSDADAVIAQVRRLMAGGGDDGAPGSSAGDAAEGAAGEGEG